MKQKNPKNKKSKIEEKDLKFMGAENTLKTEMIARAKKKLWQSKRKKKTKPDV